MCAGILILNQQFLSASPTLFRGIPIHRTDCSVMVEGTHNTSKCVETEQLRMFMSQSLGLGYDRLMNSTAEDAQLVSKYFRFDAFLG